MSKRRRYFYADTDRHGNRRWYFKPPGAKRKSRLKSAEGTKDFRVEQERLEAMWKAGTLDTPAEERGPTEGTVEWLLNQYMASGEFAALAWRTQAQRRGFYRRFCRLHGEVRVQDLRPEDIEAVRDAFGAKKSAARNFIKSMRSAFAWATDKRRRLARSNPLDDVDLPRVQTQGYKRWHLEHVETFLAYWPRGSTPRIMLAILLFTGARVNDARIMGRQHVQNFGGRPWIMFDMGKTGGHVEVPMLDLLRQELGSAYDQLCWVQREAGGPFSERSISQTFSEWCRRAGLPAGYSAHGLRKNLGSLLAELGMSEDTIMAVLGHTSAKQAREYIVEVRKRQLAERGMTAFEERVSFLWGDPAPPDFPTSAPGG